MRCLQYPLIDALQQLLQSVPNAPLKTSTDCRLALNRALPGRPLGQLASLELHPRNCFPELRLNDQRNVR
jgi:hypothetical protein